MVRNKVTVHNKVIFSCFDPLSYKNQIILENSSIQNDTYIVSSYQNQNWVFLCSLTLFKMNQKIQVKRIVFGKEKTESYQIIAYISLKSRNIRIIFVYFNEFCHFIRLVLMLCSFCETHPKYDLVYVRELFLNN